MSDKQRWRDKANDLLTDLLYEMSRALQYDFDFASPEEKRSGLPMRRTVILRWISIF